MKRNRFLRILLGFLVFLLVAGTATACDSGSGSDTNSSTNAAASAEASNAGAGLDLIFTNQPAPIFATSAYRQQLIEYEAVEALGSPTTAFFFPPGWNGSSHPFKVCPAEGLPIPNTTQLDNPNEIVEDPYGGGYNLNRGGQVEPRADPNGVYTPTSSDGTYVSCLDPNGHLRAAYWEGDMYAETGTATWGSDGYIHDVGPSQLPVCTLTHATKGDGTGLKRGVPYFHCDKANSTASDVTPLPTGTPDGHVVLTAHHSKDPLVLRCTMHSGRERVNGKVRTVQGLESTCKFPGDLSLTFAPWGILSASR